MLHKFLKKMAFFFQQFLVQGTMEILQKLKINLLRMK